MSGTITCYIGLSGQCGSFPAPKRPHDRSKFSPLTPELLRKVTALADNRHVAARIRIIENSVQVPGNVLAESLGWIGYRTPVRIVIANPPAEATLEQDPVMNFGHLFKAIDGSLPGADSPLPSGWRRLDPKAPCFDSIDEQGVFRYPLNAADIGVKVGLEEQWNPRGLNLCFAATRLIDSGRFWHLEATVALPGINVLGSVRMNGEGKIVR